MRKIRLFFPADAALWERHMLKPGDACPCCGEPLVPVEIRSIRNFCSPQTWLGCTNSQCDFLTRTGSENTE